MGWISLVLKIDKTNLTETPKTKLKIEDIIYNPLNLVASTRIFTIGFLQIGVSTGKKKTIMATLQTRKTHLLKIVILFISKPVFKISYNQC